MRTANKKKIAARSGQAVVEYILVTVAIVGFAMAAYVLLRKYVAGPLSVVKQSLEGDESLDTSTGKITGKSAGSGGKNMGNYYRNVEFTVK